MSQPVVIPDLEEPVPDTLPVAGDANGFETAGPNSQRFDVGVDFYSTPDFENGLIIFGPSIAMKLGGYVKADFIYDFDPIDSTDLFDVTTIDVGAPPRTNARYHARQTRLSADTRWASDENVVRIFVEGDFFSDGDRFRLRHAYGESGDVLVGQTWTTFTDVAAAPATLDFEGSVSSVNRRQAQARWTIPLVADDTTLALAIEDTRYIILTSPGTEGRPLSPSPDFVSHVRFKRDWGQFQAAQIYRIAGFQRKGESARTANAWGLNFTGVVLLTSAAKVYGQVVFGDGIGSYRGLPDAAPSADGEEQLLGLFGWMVGVTIDWTESVNSNFTYAESSLDNAPMQDPDDIHGNTYFAANLLWNPLDRVTVGIELLYGTRVNFDRQSGDATRVQAAFIFDLP